MLFQDLSSCRRLSKDSLRQISSLPLQTVMKALVARKLRWDSKCCGKFILCYTCRNKVYFSPDVTWFETCEFSTWMRNPGWRFNTQIVSNRSYRIFAELPRAPSPWWQTPGLWHPTVAAAHGEGLKPMAAANRCEWWLLAKPPAKMTFQWKTCGILWVFLEKWVVTWLFRLQKLQLLRLCISASPTIWDSTSLQEIQGLAHRLRLPWNISYGPEDGVHKKIILDLLRSTVEKLWKQNLYLCPWSQQRPKMSLRCLLLLPLSVSMHFTLLFQPDTLTL